MNHYVYVLLDTKSDMKYIGVRSCDCPIAEDPYMGSSTVMTTEDRLRCDKLVLKEFATRDEATEYERFAQISVDVLHRDDYWNKAIQTSTLFISNRKGCKLTEEHKRKCSEALKGRKMKPFSDEHKKKIAKARTGRKASQELKDKLSANRKGAQNSNYKHDTKYMWINKESMLFVGTPIELVDKHGVSQSGTLYGVLTGRYNYVDGWRILGNSDTGCVTTEQLYVNTYKWVHESGKEFIGRCDEFRDHINEPFLNTIKKVVRGTYKSTNGWRIVEDLGLILNNTD